MTLESLPTQTFLLTDFVLYVEKYNLLKRTYLTE